MNGIIHLKTVQSKLQLNFVPDTDYLLITGIKQRSHFQKKLTPLFIIHHRNLDLL